MLDIGMMTWLRSQANVQVFAATTGSTGVLVVGPDPDRFLVTLNGTSAGTLAIGFGDSASVGSMIQVPQQSGGIVLTGDQIPSIIHRGIFVTGSTSGLGFRVYTASYEPTKRLIYDNIVARLLRDAGSL